MASASASCASPPPGHVRFDESQIGEGRNFANKLYNATRFRLMQGHVGKEAAPQYSSVHLAIISKLRQLHADVEKRWRTTNSMP